MSHINQLKAIVVFVLGCFRRISLLRNVQAEMPTQLGIKIDLIQWAFVPRSVFCVA